MQACQHRCTQLIDHFAARMGDNNAKVAVAALQGMEKVQLPRFFCFYSFFLFSL
jgi:hypothetical protein